MSTLHKDAQISSRKDGKPEMILDYSATKGRMDNLDKVTVSYSCKSMTARWPLAIFYNTVDLSACNAFIIWTEIFPDWKVTKLFKRQLVLEEHGRAFVRVYFERR